MEPLDSSEAIREHTSSLLGDLVFALHCVPTRPGSRVPSLVERLARIPAIREYQGILMVGFVGFLPLYVIKTGESYQVVLTALIQTIHRSEGIDWDSLDRTRY